MPNVNLLTLFTIAFMAAWIPVVILVADDRGWESSERLWLMIGFGAFAVVTLGAASFMAFLEGQPLGSPHEPEIYGTKSQPLTKSETEGLPAESASPDEQAPGSP